VAIEVEKFRFDGTMIRVARVAQRRRVRELARAAGCSVSTINAAETGARRPSPETLAAICEVLSISLDDLFRPMKPRFRS
jgi:transcriptional regulator with XRE-family HTH domain